MKTQLERLLANRDLIELGAHVIAIEWALRGGLPPRPGSIVETLRVHHPAFSELEILGVIEIATQYVASVEQSIVAEFCQVGGKQ